MGNKIRTVVNCWDCLEPIALYEDSQVVGHARDYKKKNWSQIQFLSQMRLVPTVDVKWAGLEGGDCVATCRCPGRAGSWNSRSIEYAFAEAGVS